MICGGQARSAGGAAGQPAGQPLWQPDARHGPASAGAAEHLRQARERRRWDLATGGGRRNPRPKLLVAFVKRRAVRRRYMCQDRVARTVFDRHPEHFIAALADAVRNAERRKPTPLTERPAPGRPGKGRRVLPSHQNTRGYLAPRCLRVGDPDLGLLFFFLLFPHRILHPRSYRCGGTVLLG